MNKTFPERLSQHLEQILVELTITYTLVLVFIKFIEQQNTFILRQFRA